ncbi:hypothetical protein V5O48_017200 [Marasmius crinis-equi]|uniref:F-box domain-containing protein n=1 Tax=Marasmius crinis-equi TaxID=585013 RepID=A0ABR3EPM8_9AGAR
MNTGAFDNITLLPNDSPFLRSNYVPLPGQEREMVGLVQQEEQELKFCQEEIVSLRRSLENLEARKHALEVDIGRRRAVISAQRRIPTELWEMIFSCCHEFPLVIRERVTVDHPRTISRVCWRWSDIVRNCPRLWSSIHLEVNYLYYPVKDILRVYLRNSRDYPLTIQISSHPGNRSSQYTSLAVAALQTLVQHFSRCRMLILLGRHVKYLKDIEPPDLSFPRLRVLILDTLSRQATDGQKWLWQALHSAPSLVAARTLDLLPLEVLPYRQLTTLTLTWFALSPGNSMNKLFAMLSACGKLEWLRLELVGDPVSAGQSNPQPVKMPFLRSLFVDKKVFTELKSAQGRVEQIDILSTLFATLQTPALLDLGLSCEDTNGGWPTTLLDMFRRSPPPLEIFALYMKHFGIADSQLPLLELLEHTPSLYDFAFMMSRDERSGSSFSERPYGTLKTVVPFLSDFLTKLQEPSPPEPWFLPALENVKLCVNGVNLDVEVVDAVLRIAASRSPKFAEASDTMWPLNSFTFTRHPNRSQREKDRYENSSLESATLEAIAELEREGVMVQLEDSECALCLDRTHGLLSLPSGY